MSEKKRVLPIIEKKSECDKTSLSLTYVLYGIYLLSSYELHYTSTSATHVELFRGIFRNLSIDFGCKTNKIMKLYYFYTLKAV